ncbi:Opsin, partial [Operophtera brumata]
MNTLTYIMFLFAMGQIVPLSVITFSYRLGRVSRAEARATAMVFVMIVAFTVAWTPYSLFALMEQREWQKFVNKGVKQLSSIVAVLKHGSVEHGEWFCRLGHVSPGAGVIPALVAKSSICYDPLIYVGMNTQFRQSIKRIFGIHSKGKDSHTEKYNNTLVSPAHKLSSLNSTRLPSPDGSQFPKIKDKKLQTDISEASHYETQRAVTRNPELGTIQENKSASEAERSSEILYDDESSSQKKVELFGESCKAVKDGSPVLTYIDSGRLLFTKGKNNFEENVYGNVAYEAHPNDEMGIENFNIENEYSFQKQKIIRPSCSLDFGRYPCEDKKRKLSVETKLETVIQPKGFFKDTFNKLFEYDTSGQDSFKSYLCERKIQLDNENL